MKPWNKFKFAKYLKEKFSFLKKADIYDEENQAWDDGVDDDGYADNYRDTEMTHLMDGDNNSEDYYNDGFDDGNDFNPDVEIPQQDQVDQVDQGQQGQSGYDSDDPLAVLSRIQNYVKRIWKSNSILDYDNIDDFDNVNFKQYFVDALVQESKGFYKKNDAEKVLESLLNKNNPGFKGNEQLLNMTSSGLSEDPEKFGTDLAFAFMGDPNSRQSGGAKQRAYVAYQMKKIKGPDYQLDPSAVLDAAEGSVIHTLSPPSEGNVDDRIGMYRNNPEALDKNPQVKKRVNDALMAAGYNGVQTLHDMRKDPSFTGNQRKPEKLAIDKVLTPILEESSPGAKDGIMDLTIEQLAKGDAIATSYLNRRSLNYLKDNNPDFKQKSRQKRDPETGELMWKDEAKTIPVNEVYDASERSNVAVGDEGLTLTDMQQGFGTDYDSPLDIADMNEQRELLEKKKEDKALEESEQQEDSARDEEEEKTKVQYGGDLGEIHGEVNKSVDLLGDMVGAVRKQLSKDTAIANEKAFKGELLVYPPGRDSVGKSPSLPYLMTTLFDELGAAITNLTEDYFNNFGTENEPKEKIYYADPERDNGLDGVQIKGFDGNGSSSRLQDAIDDTVIKSEIVSNTLYDYSNQAEVSGAKGTSVKNAPRYIGQDPTQDPKAAFSPAIEKIVEYEKSKSKDPSNFDEERSRARAFTFVKNTTDMINHAGVAGFTGTGREPMTAIEYMKFKNKSKKNGLKDVMKESGYAYLFDAANSEEHGPNGQSVAKQYSDEVGGRAKRTLLDIFSPDKKSHLDVVGGKRRVETEKVPRLNADGTPMLNEKGKPVYEIDEATGKVKTTPKIDPSTGQPMRIPKKGRMRYDDFMGEHARYASMNYLRKMVKSQSRFVKARQSSGLIETAQIYELDSFEKVTKKMNTLMRLASKVSTQRAFDDIYNLVIEHEIEREKILNKMGFRNKG